MPLPVKVQIKVQAKLPVGLPTRLPVEAAPFPAMSPQGRSQAQLPSQKLALQLPLHESTAWRCGAVTLLMA